MHKVKIIMSTVLSVVMIFASGVTAMAEKINMTLFYDGTKHSYSAESVGIFIDEKELTGLDMPPVIINDRALVPARAVFENLGAEVVWNAETKQVYADSDENLVVLTIDSSTVYKNGESFLIDVPPKIINDRTMIPIRCAAEAMDCRVDWDSETREISIYTAEYQKKEEEKNNNNGNNTTSQGEEPVEEAFRVTGIVLPDSASAKQEFTIKTDGEILRYESFTLTGNRLVVDIYGANMALSNNNISVGSSTVVKSIRSSQYSTSPERVTRLVFDLSALPEYTVSLNEDKNRIKVSFNVNYLEDLSFSALGKEDIITISSKEGLSYDICQNMEPYNVTLDIYGAVSDLSSVYSAKGKYVTGINVYKTDSATTRIVMDTKGLVSFRESSDSKGLTIAIKESTLKNISYDKASNSIILENPSGLSAGIFGMEDNYASGEYIIYFNGDYEDIYGYGEVNVNDSDGIKSFDVHRGSDGRTRIYIKENYVMEFRATSAAGKIYLKGINPRELYDNIIVIDPGHGKSDPGAIKNGITEKDANLGVIKHLNKYLESDGRFKVYATRLDDSYPANSYRAKLGNMVGDLFISVHMNSATNTEAKGTEVLYHTHSDENEGSGKVTGRILATEIQRGLVEALGTESRGIKSRPDLIVLNSTNIPAVLVEVCFISNAEDAALISSEEGKDLAARAIYEAVVRLYNKYDFR